MPSSLTINKILKQRNAELLDNGGNPKAARLHFPYSRMLWENYKAYNPLRLHISHNSTKKLYIHNDRLHGLVDRLIAAGFLERINGHYFKPTSQEARRWLLGDWLEELTFLAALEAGADEARFSQRVSWRVNGTCGENEIDVIARKGDVISFISCKATIPSYQGISTPDRNKLRSFLFEADYWEQHFADGNGRAVLVLSTDLLDEDDGLEPYCPTLMARAEVLHANIIGNEDNPWQHLVRCLEQHW